MSLGAPIGESSEVCPAAAVGVPPPSSATWIRFKGGALIACLLALALAAPAEAAAPPALSIDLGLELATAGAPKLSPDGMRVVFEQSRTNWESNAFETDLWIADVAKGERRLLTNGVKSSADAAWSPDGRWIAFLSNRPGALAGSPADAKQLYVIAADGGEARQLTKVEKGVKALSWMPDSKSLAFTAEAPDAETLKDRKETFGDYRVIHADYAMVQLWRVSLPKLNDAGRPGSASEPIALTKGTNFSIGAFAVSPDGGKIAFDAQRDPDLISQFSADIYVLTLMDGSLAKIVDTYGPDIGPTWSPDGRQIAFETSAGSKTFFYANRKIAVVDATGGSLRVLTDRFDEDARSLQWTTDGIYFSALRKTEAGLFLADPKTGAVTSIPLPGTPIARQFSFASKARGAPFAWLGSGPNQLPEIFVGASTSITPAKITRLGDQLAKFGVAQREIVRWRSHDGTPIEGVLTKPADFDPKKTYPLLVVSHGGPTGVDTPAFSPDRYYPVEQFAAKGALVLRPNYRGSAGYGEKFRALNVRKLGVDDYADVISGVDALIARGIVDKARVGAMGWSQGGYISAFITTSSDRFKAVSVGAGISDWMTYYANTDITPFTRQYLLATPWDDPEIYKKTSPISYLAHARTPTLIQHGGEDRRVPPANAFELRQALEDRGVPVKMVVYAGFGHPIDKPKQQRAVLEENFAWFSHYIWGDPLPADLTPRAKAAKP